MARKLSDDHKEKLRQNIQKARAARLARLAERLESGQLGTTTHPLPDSPIVKPSNTRTKPPKPEPPKVTIINPPRPTKHSIAPPGSLLEKRRQLMDKAQELQDLACKLISHADSMMVEAADEIDEMGGTKILKIVYDKPKEEVNAN